MKPVILAAAGLAAVAPLLAAEWSVPAGGNTFRTAPAPGPGVSRDGSVRWSDKEGVFSIYVHLDRPAALELSLKAKSPDGSSKIRTAVRDQSFETTLTADGSDEHPLGKVEVPKAGYLRIDLQGIERTGSGFAIVRELGISSDTEGLQLDFVKSNEGNMFYWGRRGPSVHLGYQLPRDRKIRHAYSEITVPEGEDPIGSYFMANGFGQGYFGMQVKSPTERWVLFSVWSPFKTNNPKEIPEEDRVITLGTGEGVRAQDFGHEGSGGQSFLTYPWKAGVTYRFLTEVIPDGKGNTTYTSWFGDKAADEWRLIASFRRPKTDTHYTGFHSFLENFAPDYGAIGRKALHGNQWARDTEGEWHELTRARFTADGTARGGHRLDYAGGTEDGVFFMRNGGFFDERVKFDQWFERESAPELKPEIDLDKLPQP
ncbi:nematoblast specific protein [Haloferula helveola]|uniref:Nematoblast specific protein n=1 Tax=Haloferula helveola TaxID=490095 RepID=A0ABN6H3U3_9BACT|nr:nematoblast specific protein [Haloferula helveola]